METTIWNSGFSSLKGSGLSVQGLMLCVCLELKVGGGFPLKRSHFVFSNRPRVAAQLVGHVQTYSPLR